jgi:hypothetical protein
VLGSPLSITDLKKVKADTAQAIFFLVNADLHESMAKVEDASVVLAALSVGNYNSKLTSFVQVRGQGRAGQGCKYCIKIMCGVRGVGGQQICTYVYTNLSPPLPSSPLPSSPCLPWL